MQNYKNYEICKKYNHTIIPVGKERLSTVLQKEYRVS